MRVITPIVLSLPLLMIGCSDERQLRQWQQQQVEQLQEQAQQNAEASRTLIETDSKARQELVAIQRDLQTDQHELARQRDLLDADRKDVAETRARVPLLATAFQGLAALLLCSVALAVCGYLLRGLSKDTRCGGTRRPLGPRNRWGDTGLRAAVNDLANHNQSGSDPAASFRIGLGCTLKTR